MPSGWWHCLQWLMTHQVTDMDCPDRTPGTCTGITTSVNWLNLQVFRNHRFWLSLYRTTATITYGFQDVGISFHPLMIFWFGSHICNLNFQQMAGVHQPGLLAKMVGFSQVSQPFSCGKHWKWVQMIGHDGKRWETTIVNFLWLQMIGRNETFWTSKPLHFLQILQSQGFWVNHWDQQPV